MAQRSCDIRISPSASWRSEAGDSIAGPSDPPSIFRTPVLHGRVARQRARTSNPTCQDSSRSDTSLKIILSISIKSSSETDQRAYSTPSCPRARLSPGARSSYDSSTGSASPETFCFCLPISSQPHHLSSRPKISDISSSLT